MAKRKIVSALLTAGIILSNFSGLVYAAPKSNEKDNFNYSQQLDTIASASKTKDSDVSKGKLELQWYSDGDYSRNQDGEDSSPEQYFVIFNKPIRNGKFKIIVPDKSKQDPYGEGKLLCLEQGKDFIITEDPCREDGWKDGEYCSKYTIELLKDWTRILNTSKTGRNYYDKNYRDIRLLVEDVDVKKQDAVKSIIAEKDITLVKDTQAPRIVYQQQVISKTDNKIGPAGFVRFATNEPVQINDPKAIIDDHHGKDPITPSQKQGNSIPEFKAKYIQVEDAKGKKVEKKVEVRGIYTKGGCLWKNSLEGNEVGEKFQYNVHPFDDKNRIKCIRDFGWHGVIPETELRDGKWKLVINGITDDVGNMMKEHIIQNVIINNGNSDDSQKDNVEHKDFKIEVKDINLRGLKIKISNLKEDKKSLKLNVIDPKGRKIDVKPINVNKDAKDVFFEFKDKLPIGIPEAGEWKVNGIIYNVEKQLDWYADGDFLHNGKGQDSSPEQFVIYLNKPVKRSTGMAKIIIPNKNNKDPYGSGKLGEINFAMNGSLSPQALKNVNGGSKVTCFVVPDDCRDRDVKEGYTNRFILELTEDWTRILNTKETGLHYYDNNIKGLKLILTGFEDESGNIIEKIESKRNINLEKDNQKPYIVAHKPLYTKIGENGFQDAGKTRIVFNKPVQFLTQDMVDKMKKAGIEQPFIWNKHNPITPSQEQLESKFKGVPIFESEFYKVDDNGNNILDENKKPIIIKGVYGLGGDIMEADDEGDGDPGEKITLRFNQVDFKYDLDPTNRTLSRFRDYGMYYIHPQKGLTEGKWKVKVRNISDDVGNVMDEYVSDVINIEKYFEVQELTKEGIKIKFNKPFTRNKVHGYRIPIIILNENRKMVAFTWVENLKEGQLEAEAKFNKPLATVNGTFNINNMKYTQTNKIENKDMDIKLTSKQKQFKVGQDAKITFNVTNKSKEDKKATLVTALYDKDNKLICYTAGSHEIKKGSSSELTGLFKVLANGYKIKCFVWDGIDTMKSLVNPIEMPVVK